LKNLIFLLILFHINLFAITITEDTTLTENTTYNEDVVLDGKILNLNGYTLTVNGNFKTTGSYARLQMLKSDDKLIVKGDVTFAGASTYNDLTKGVIELTGDFYQKGTKSDRSSYHTDYLNGTYSGKGNKYSSDNAYSFYPTGEHKVVFNGSEKQTISLDSPRYSRFMNIEIDNSSSDGVEFEELNIVGELIRNNNNISIQHIENWILTENIVVPNDLDVYEALNLNGYTLTVNGNFKTTGSYARLQMLKSDDKLIVKGDVTFAGASTYNDLTKGVIELTGDFYQKGTKSDRSSYHTDYLNGTYSGKGNKYSSDNAYSFYPTGEHKVVFNGSEKQTISLDSPRYSRFMNIEIDNNIQFEQSISALGTLYTTQELYNSTYINSTKLTYVNYLDSLYYYLDIQAGMNLIALPNNVDLTLEDIKTIFKNNITTVWAYDGSTTKWRGFSEQSDKLEKINELELVSLESISKGQGIIVNSLVEQTLLFPKGDDYNIANLNILENLSAGWHMVGTNRAISISEIEKLNENIVSIWSYDGTNWFANATDNDFILNIEKRGIKSLTSIESNRAFWIFVK